MAQQMNAAWYKTPGEARQVLHISKMDVPAPKEGEVLVRIHASGINPVDIKRRSGNYKAQGYERIVPHDDGAGVIEAVGEGVDKSRVGEIAFGFITVGTTGPLGQQLST